MYLVLDIETIPDLSVWSPPVAGATGDTTFELTEAGKAALAAAAPAEVPAAATTPKPRKRTAAPKAPKASKDVFPPLYAHRPIAISIVGLDDDLNFIGSHVFSTSAYGDNEGALIAAFTGYVDQNRPTLVTWNGRGFDLPVLALRSFYLGLQQRWYSGEMRQRYREDQHIDLFMALTEWSPRIADFNLSAMSKLLGLPDKGEITGPKVNDLWKQKQIGLIDGYCLCDSYRTAFVLFRYLLMRGRITLDQYRTAASALLTKANEYQLTSIVLGADTKKLLLES